MPPDMIAPPSDSLLAESPVPLLLDDDITDPPVPVTLTTALQGSTEKKAPGKATKSPQEAPGTARPAPPTPTWAEHEALLQGFCGALQAKMQEQLHAFMVADHKTMAESLNDIYLVVERRLKALNEQNEHSLYQFSDALLKMQEHGTQVRHDPYTITVHAQSAHGFPVEVRLRKQDKGELVQETLALLDWLVQQGFMGKTEG